MVTAQSSRRIDYSFLTSVPSAIPGRRWTARRGSYSDYLPEDNGRCFCRAFGFGEQLSFEIGHLQQQAFAILKILPDDQVDPVNMCLTSQLAAVLRKFGVLPHHPTQGRDRADYFSRPDQHYGRRLSRYDDLKTNPLAK